MKRLFISLAAALAVLALAPGVADAQFPGGANKARATLHTRVDGETVRAAVEIRIERGWHLYHDELGHPEAIGKPTKLAFSGAGIAWGTPRFPEPHETPQMDDVFILSHSGTIVVYAAGRLDRGVDGATGEDVSVEIDGLTCEDDGLCVPYGETVRSAGPGDDALFEAFPADLAASVPAARPSAPADEHKGGKADATLYTRTEGGTVRVAIEIEIERGWHLYHEELGHPDAVGQPTTVGLGGDGIVWGEVRFPEPHRYEQPDWDAFILGHEGTIVLYAEGELAPGVEAAEPVTAKLVGLTCEDDGMCIPYRETVHDRGPGPDALFAAASAIGETEREADAEAPAEAAPVLEGAEDGLAGFLWLAVFWGLFTLLMPCTYPMIPITVSFFTKQAADRGGNVLPLSLAYGAGIVLIFILIGVTIGQVIIDFAVNPWTNLVIGALFLYFALVLFGVVNLQPPRVLLELAGKASTTGGYLGVFLMGATLVVTSFTCTAPFVGSLLAVGGVERSLGEIALGMGVFGLTMAVPFVVLSFVPRLVQNMPRSGEWMNTLKVFLGFVELAAAFKFLSNSDLVWEWDLLSRELFLLLWTAIFVLAGVFLLGLLPGKRAKPGPARAVIALVVLGFSGYCAWGMTGKDMDAVMTAIIPNYSGGAVMPAWKDFGGEWRMVVDDYDEALEVARAEDKLLLVNFTGHT